MAKRHGIPQRTTLSVQPAGFYPVNDGVNQQMVRTALEWLDLRARGPGCWICSAGWAPLLLPLATRAAHVAGRGRGAGAGLEKGRETPPAMSLSNVTFFHENLEEDVTRQAWAKHGFDKVLLDPARRRAGRDAAYNKTGTAAGGVCFLQPGDAGARQRNPVAGWISDSTPGDAGYVPAYRPSGINGVV